MISLQNISKSYKDHKVLDDISLDFNPGQITTILGPSGCGKSTLLKLINRTLEIEQGRIFINGVDTLTIPETDLRRSIGYAIQGIGLFPHMTVAENIKVVPKLLKWDPKAIEDRVHKLMDMVELPRSFLKKYPLQLSGGEAQRVGVARALAGNPDILLMDEPFGALDPITRSKLQKALLNIQMKLKKTILFVTHDVSEALIMGDEMILMKDQKILKKDQPHKMILNSKELLKSFTGGSFAIDLLEKNTLSHYLHLLAADSGPLDPMALDPQITLKEALSEMILRQEDMIQVMDKDHRYRLTFKDIARFSKGLDHV